MDEIMESCLKCGKQTKENYCEACEEERGGGECELCYEGNCPHDCHSKENDSCGSDENGGRQVDEAILASIKSVIDYLWKDEKRHWQECGKPEHHIFTDLKRLKEFVHKY